MQNKDVNERLVRALVGTSSLMAHDVSGQLHVALFCMEEIKDSVAPEGKKYFERFEKSLENLSEIILSYRHFLKLPHAELEQLSLGDLFVYTESQFKIHAWKEKKELLFSFDSELELVHVEQNDDICNFLAGYLTAALEKSKESKENYFKVNLRLMTLDSTKCVITILSDNAILSLDEFRLMLEKSPMNNEKAIRIISALDMIDQGNHSLKIDFCSDGVGLELNLKE